MKVISCLLVVLMALMMFAPVSFAKGEGGVMGFVVGCCFGARSGAAFNDGKGLHWTEWGLVIPFANIVVSILNGVNGMNGMTTSDMAAQYGTQYY